MKKRYSVRVYLRHPIYLEVESNLDDDRDAIFDAVSALMLRENRDTAVYESVNQEAEPDIILRKDGSVRYPRAIGHRREYPRLKAPYTNDLLDYAALVDPERLKAHLTHLGWTFEPWGDGIEVGRFGGIVCQIPTSNHFADYDFAVAQIPEKMAAHNPVEALKLAAWIAREYHQAMCNRLGPLQQEREKALQTELLKLDETRPLPAIVANLLQASKILYHYHNFDGHGHEVLADHMRDAEGWLKSMQDAGIWEPSPTFDFLGLPGGGR